MKAPSRTHRRTAGVFAVLGVMVVGCGGEATREDIRTANDRIVEYCEPFRNKPRPDPAVMKRAVAKLAEEEKRSPDEELRIDDSEEPSTAGQLLDGLSAYAEGRGCSAVEAAIRDARGTNR